MIKSVSSPKKSPIFTKTEKRYLFAGLGLLIPFLGFSFTLIPYTMYQQNKEMAKKFAERGYPPTLDDVPLLTGGIGSKEEQKRLYEEAKARGETLVTWEIDYMAIKDSKIAKKAQDLHEIHSTSPDY